MIPIDETRIPRRARGERAFRAGDEVSFSVSKSYTPQKETGRYSNASQKATSRQELERFHGCRPRPSPRHVWRITLTRQFAISQAMPGKPAHCLCEYHRIGLLAVTACIPTVSLIGRRLLLCQFRALLFLSALANSSLWSALSPCLCVSVVNRGYKRRKNFLAWSSCGKSFSSS